MDDKIKYIVKEGEQRSRDLAYLGFLSILKIIEPEVMQENIGLYPMPLKYKTVQYAFNDEKRLKKVLRELIYDRYELSLKKALCYIVQEIPMYCAITPNEYVQERIYRGVHLLGGQYYDKWANDDGEEKTCEWFACEGEDATIVAEFAALHRCGQGEIVQVVKDDCLTVGIVVNYCNDGCYDMWVWNEAQDCSRERIPASRILYNTEGESFAISNEIKEELKKRVIQ